MMKIHFYWGEVLDYFEHLVSERDIFLNPERHDGLLSDDESFSRSKRYFWAITTLKELDLSISDNLLQIRRLLDARAPVTIEKLRKAELEDARSCLEIRYKEIEGVATKLREKRQEAGDLRDGVRLIRSSPHLFSLDILILTPHSCLAPVPLSRVALQPD